MRLIRRRTAAKGASGAGRPDTAPDTGSGGRTGNGTPAAGESGTRRTAWLPKQRDTRPARLDPAYGDPQLARLRQAAAAGGWPAMRALLAPHASREPTEPTEPTAGDDAGADRGDELSRLVEGVMTVPGTETWLADAVAAAPGDPLPLLLSAARHVAWAWEARSHKQARYVEREQFEVFHTRLRIAEEQLYEVAERVPHWAAPWYLLQMSGRGLQVGQDIAARRFEAAVRRCPGHLGAHRQRMQQLCPKWGGSLAQTHEFARASMLAAPEGDPMGELVATAHLEQWLDEGGAAAGDGVSVRMRRPEVVAQLHEAADRSVRHPQFVRRRDWTRSVNTFALAFSLAGERSAAAALFRELDGCVTEFPWSYLDGQDPTAPFRAWRSRAGD